jgi:hypothetical protein
MPYTHFGYKPHCTNMPIKVEVYFAEFLDKITIQEIKIERISNAVKLENGN